jgi:hypothetical protein
MVTSGLTRLIILTLPSGEKPQKILSLILQKANRLLLMVILNRIVGKRMDRSSAKLLLLQTMFSLLVEEEMALHSQLQVHLISSRQIIHQMDIHQDIQMILTVIQVWISLKIFHSNTKIGNDYRF